ncbi:MAG: DUF58 domain-containing protein [Pirellulales bacterium]|nr:DUF58 domain-containing protein [Pirellulales bacterium]
MHLPFPLPRLRRFAICPEAGYFVVVFGVALAGAMLKEVNLLFVLAGMILGPVAINAWWVVRSLRRLAPRRRMPRSVCAGDLLVVQVEMENNRRRQSSWAVVVEDQIRRAGEPTLRPRVYFPHVRPGQTGETAYQGRLVRRGRYDVGPFRVSTRFPFGVVRYTVTLGTAQTLLVCPRLGRLARGWLGRQREAFEGAQRRQARTSRVEGEFFGVRDWRDGDGKRAVHWRSSARRGGLVVRQFEQPHSRDVAVLVELWQPSPAPGPAERDAVELAVSFAATAVADVCRQGGAELLVGTTAAPAAPLAGPASAALVQEVMEHLALADAQPEDRLPALLAGALDEIANGTDIILISTRPVDLDDPGRFARVWSDGSRRAKRRQIRLVDTSGDQWNEYFEIDAPGAMS